MSRKKLPAAKHEKSTPAGLPDPFPESYAPFVLDKPGRWLILSDIHVPYHDRGTILAAVAEAKRRGVVGVILNGDTLDSHEISRHDKDPRAPRYIEEIELGKQLFEWLRGRFPSARIVAKEGNHEERLEVYVVQRAPALFGVNGLDVASLLGLSDIGIEWVAHRRVIALGKLNVVHGHEFPGGGSGGVSPARALYLKARAPTVCGHYHRYDEHHGRDVRGRTESAWTLGCCCYLSPRYMPLNNWSHGFAVVEVAADGSFVVDNLRVIDGKAV